VKYKTSIVEAILSPDGYDMPGNFYTDAQGMPSYLGPLVTAYEYDLVNFEMTNAIPPCPNASEPMMPMRKRSRHRKLTTTGVEEEEECVNQATHCKWRHSLSLQRRRCFDIGREIGRRITIQKLYNDQFPPSVCMI